MSAVFGVVVDSFGTVRRIINPTHGVELALHHVGADERMVVLSKADYGISPDRDGMTIGDVAMVVESMKRP